MGITVFAGMIGRDVLRAVADTGFYVPSGDHRTGARRRSRRHAASIPLPIHKMLNTLLKRQRCAHRPASLAGCAVGPKLQAPRYGRDP